MICLRLNPLNFLAVKLNAPLFYTSTLLTELENQTCHRIRAAPFFASRNASLTMRKEDAMSGYVISNYTVNDQEKYEKYPQAVLSTVQRYGGKYIIRDDDAKAKGCPHNS
jgi:hypothetical protein